MNSFYKCEKSTCMFLRTWQTFSWNFLISTFLLEWRDNEQGRAKWLEKVEDSFPICMFIWLFMNWGVVKMEHILCLALFTCMGHGCHRLLEIDTYAATSYVFLCVNCMDIFLVSGQWSSTQTETQSRVLLWWVSVDKESAHLMYLHYAAFNSSSSCLQTLLYVYFV